MKFNFTLGSTVSHVDTAGAYQLTIDKWGDSPAYIKSVEGGFPKANPIEEPFGQDLGFIKHVSTIEIEPMSFEIGMESGVDVLMWIKESWRREYSRRSGSITHANFDGKSTLEHHFYNALITETTFPALDANGKEPAYLKFKIQPEGVEFKPGDKNKVKGILPPRQKAWVPSAFRFTLGGVDVSKVSKIDGFSVKQGVKALHTGLDRFPQWEPTNIKFPDLSIHMSKIWAGPVMSWYNDFVIKGHQDPKAEKQGSIEFLAPNLKDTVFRINLYNVGIKGFSVDKVSANEDQMKKVKFDLYVGRMDLDGAAGSALSLE